MRRWVGVVAAAAGALVVLAAPAAADADLEVEAGYVDGQIVPGRPVPVRVQVRSDQLVTGTVAATPYTLGEAGETVTVPIEVAGGSVKDYLVVVPTRWDGGLGPSEMRVTLRTGEGEPVETTAALSWSGDAEVVGVVPGLVSQTPDPVPLPRGLGRAVFTQLDPLALATPGALGPLGSIVTGPDGLSALPAEAQHNVLEWVEGGGQLLVDAPPGSPVAGLPAAWQPEGDRASAGEGWVRLTDGAAARGQWADIVEPTRQFDSGELMSVDNCCFAGLADSVARDAGLRIPDVGWLLAFLVAYVVVAGPLTFVALRRVRRTGLIWVAVPLVAVLFTGVAFTAGSSLRRDARAAHGSLVQVSPLGDRAVSYLGLVSRDGRDPTAMFPTGWQAGGIDPRTLSGGFVDSGMGGLPVAPVALEGDDGRPGVRLPLSSGDFGLVSGRGRLEGESPLAVTATAAADGSVSGTVTSTADFDLEKVIVVVAGHVADIGDLPAGGEVEWSIDAVAGDPTRGDPWAPVEEPWSAAIGRTGEPDPDSIVNYAVYAAELAGDIDSYAPGVAVAAGWTTGWSPPVDVGSGAVGGRTGVVARSVVTPAPGTLPAAAVRREFVRGPGVTPLDPPIHIPDWGDARGAVARFTLPAGTDPATPLVLDASAPIVQAEVWDGQAWVPVELAEAPPPGAGGPAEVGAGPVVGGGASASAVVVAPAAPVGEAQPEPVPAPAPAPAPTIVGQGLDPFGPPRQAVLPAGSVQGGTVYVRVAMSPDMTSRLLLQVRGAA